MESLGSPIAIIADGNFHDGCGRRHQRSIRSRTSVKSLAETLSNSDSIWETSDANEQTGGASRRNQLRLLFASVARFVNARAERSKIIFQ